MIVASSVSAAPARQMLNTGAGPWEWMQPNVQGSTINSVSFIDASTGWAVGIGGTILKTTDGGVHWSSLVSGTSYNLLSVKFVDANNGWAVGMDNLYSLNGIILHTADGGNTWSGQSYPATQPAGLSGISFSSATSGVAVGQGSGSYAFYTNNGGATWTAATGASSGLNAAQMVSSSIGYAVGYGGIYKTTNGGASWNQYNAGGATQITGSDFRSVYFVDATHGYAVGAYTNGTKGRLLKTVDGGANWTYSSDSVSLGPLNSVAVIGGTGGTAHTIVAVGTGGTILKLDSVPWSDSADTVATNLAAAAAPVSGTTSSLATVAFPGGGSTGFAAGGAGAVTKSTDSGGTWNLAAGGAGAASIYSSSFLDANNGWLVGSSGTVTKTTNGGVDWAADNAFGGGSISTDVTLRSVQFLNSSTGFAVGSCNTSSCAGGLTPPVSVAYKYSSGVWSAMSGASGTGLLSIHMTSATSGWAVGKGSIVLKTTDGASWHMDDTGIGTVELNSVDSTDAASNGWAVGQAPCPTGCAPGQTTKGIIYKYSGGVWTSTDEVATDFLTSVDMVDANNGYAVGDWGVLYKTINGGTTWTAQNSGTSRLLASVSFVPGDANTGFAVGAQGRIIHTRDGGQTWLAENLGTFMDMYTMATIGNRQAFAGGSNGAVLKSNRPYYFTWYDNQSVANGKQAQNWVLMSNPTGSSQTDYFDLFVGGLKRPLGGNGVVAPGNTLYAQYPGVIGGPVNAASLTSDKAIISQRILWAGNSLEEVLGQNIDKLSDHYYWTWYDQTGGKINWVLVANPVPFPVWCEIKVAGTLRYSGYVQPGQNVTPTFPGVMGGPVEVQAWTTDGKTAPANIMASQRVLSNGDSAFNEVPGIPAADLASDYLWTWYDQQSSGFLDWVMIANPTGAPVTYQVKIGSEVQPVSGTNPGTIPAYGKVTPSFSGKMDGPVEVTASANVIASQRVAAGPSFEEVPGYPQTALASDYHWTWYDQQSPGSLNWVMIANPGGTDVTYQIKIAGVVQPTTGVNPGTVPAHGRVMPSFPGQMSGPVEVIATGGNVMVSQRVTWNGFFNETLGTVLN